jgi:hypothetical protein
VTARLSDALRARLAAERERELTLEEAQRYLEAPIDEDERASTLELARWFCRRYPTPAERLAYVRRAFRRWMSSRGEPGPPT